MAAARKKSARQSATSGGGRPDRLTFFIDECLGRKALPDALRAAGHGVVLHHERFDPGTDDVQWLTALYDQREAWVVLTKDKKIKKRPLEKQALMAAGLRVFALTAGELTIDAQAEAFVRGLRRIVRISKQAGPYIARVTAGGDVQIVERPKPGLRKKRRMRVVSP